MDKHAKKAVSARPAGYTALIERFGLDVMPNWHRSIVAPGNTRKVETAAGVVEEVYPAKYWPGERPGEHIEFALKYDGTNLAILACLFEVMALEDILRHVASRPTGKYARRLWFLYEWLTGQRLPLDDLTQGNYIDLLDPKDYFTVKTVYRVRRQRVNNNLLGDARFCPTIRRTATLHQFRQDDLPARCQAIVSGYAPQLLKRAMRYLYTKETKSSFEIEHIKPNATRTERFITLLQLAETEDFCSKERLIELQNRIADPRFRDTDFRTSQNYVGETLMPQREKVHFVAPKPSDITGLMEGLIATHRLMAQGETPAVIHAAAIAYGFVFLHPFEDGNGRIHRFLIHNILAQRGFTPAGIVFPVSAAMSRDMAAYDESLETFSRPLMSLIDYTIDDNGRMSVENETAKWYRFIDLTSQAEALLRFVEQTIDVELVEELAFLASYDQAKRAIREVVDMPDQKIDLFIQACLQNNGRLSARKRASHFAFLSDEEVTHMEQSCQSAYGGEQTTPTTTPTDSSMD